LEFNQYSPDTILKNLKGLRNIFKSICKSNNPDAELKWIMGNLRPLALGNIPLNKLREMVGKELSENGGKK
jgi:glutamyl-tRNA(Gln) amidotransferase subunit E